MDENNTVKDGQNKISSLISAKKLDVIKPECSQSDTSNSKKEIKHSEGDSKEQTNRCDESENIYATDSLVLQKSLTEQSSRESESISEEIIVNESNNPTLAEDVNNSSNHISIPSLNLPSTSQSSLHHTSSSKTPSDLLLASKTETDVEKEESSKLDIVYVEEENSPKKIRPTTGDSVQKSLNSEKSLHSNLEDSLESPLLKSKIHQNSDISQESYVLVSDNVDIIENMTYSSGESNNQVNMNESVGDPPLQLNVDSDEEVEGGGDGDSSLSDNVIKLDIRGQASASKPFQYISKVIYNYDNVIPTSLEAKTARNDPSFKTTEVNLSPSRNIYFMENLPNVRKTIQSIPVSNIIECDNKDDDYEQDFAIEEIIMNQSREIFPPKDEAQEKHEPECSMSTVTTDYKTLCEDFHTKLPDILSQKDNIIDKLKSSLQEAVKSKDDLEIKYEELATQLSTYQKLLSERPDQVDSSKEQQLSDFVKHEQFVHENVNVGLKVNDAIENIHATVDASDDGARDKESKQPQDINLETQTLVDVSQDRDTLLTYITKQIMEKMYNHVESMNNTIAKPKNSVGEMKRVTLNEVLSSIKPDNPDLLNYLGNIEKKHKSELENLRTYFEDRCMKIKKQYSEEIFNEHSKKASPNSSLDSLDNCPEALPFGSPLHGAGDRTTYLVPNTITRSHSAEFNIDNYKVSTMQHRIHNLEEDHQLQMKNIRAKNEKDIDDLKISYDLHVAQMEENYKNEISNLKAHIQTLENSANDNGILLEQRNADNDLEEALTLHSKSDISSWPREFIAFKEKCELEMQQIIDNLKVAHVEELSAMENENKKQLEIMTDKCRLEVDKWKQKRNDAFDKNRNLEETIRERDGLRHMTHTLQKVLSYLVKHFNMCEDELNNTFVGELFKFLDEDDLDNTLLVGSFTSSKNHEIHHSTTSLNVSRDNLEISTVSTKRVHIAPKFSEIMPFIETNSILDCLDKTQDISINFKQELDTCLMRLHDEAQELLLLSQAPKRKSILGPNNDQKPTKDHANVEELLQEHQELQDKYEKSENTKKNLEEALEQSAYREASLKAELQEAFDKMTSYQSTQHRDSSECYSPLSPPTRLAAELQAANSEREDMQMQLEAANKQLRSTKQFLEEQAAEREHERDEFQRDLKQLKEENNKLLQKNQQFVRISKEVDQLETLIRDMTNKICDLERENHTKQTELASSLEEIAILRDLIGNLESQMETKSSQETEVMKDLENYRLLAEEKDTKLKDVSRELTILKNDVATKIADDLLAGNKKKDGVDSEMEAEKKIIQQMRGELQSLLKVLSDHTTGLESLHEAICSQSCSSPSEDVSIRDHKKWQNKEEPPLDISNGRLPVLELWQLGDGLQRHLRAEDAAVKRIRDLEMQLVQLKDISQELRMERDVLQERMCEQSLKISSLQSRLDQTRHTVEAQSYHNMEGLRRQLDEALAEVQLLRESLDSKDKQLKVFEGTPSPESSREFIQRLKRDLEEFKNKSREMQKMLDEKQVEYEIVLADKNADIEVLRQQLLERERHLQAVISLQVDEDKEKELVNDGKLSARTLSDILSISEFDEPDLMRKAEPAGVSYVSGQFPLHSNDTKDNDTGLPNVNSVMQLPLGNSNINYSNLHREVTPDRQKEVSLPNVREESHTSKDQHQTNQIIHTLSHNALSENFSLFPNKNASGDKNITIQPKKLDFSVANLLEELDKRPNRNPFSLHNLSLNEPLYTSGESNKIIPPYKSLDDLGIVADYQQTIYPDILTQLKSEIHILKEELNAKTTALRMAHEQLSEFPLVKKDMEELEKMLQNSLGTMQDDKKYYNSQLENFTLGEKILQEELEQAHNQVKEKCDEIRILKEDILRRETLVSEIYKEKKCVEVQLTELEEKCKMLENNSSKSQHLKDKLSEFEKLEQMISEKNLQIDNLNENLDKLDDLQKQVIEQKSLNDNLNSNLIKKMKEIADIQQENQHLKHQGDQLCVENKKLASDLKRTSNKNTDLQTTLRVYRDMFTLLEKDLEGILQKQVASPRTAGGAVISPDHEEIVKYEEYKQLLSGLEGPKSPSSDTQSESFLESQRCDILNKIRLKVNTLQSELHSKRKELSIKALQVEKAKLEIDDLKIQVEYYNKGESDKNNMLQELILERDELRNNLRILSSRLREESNMAELHEKLVKKTEECKELEMQISNLKPALEKNKSNNSNSAEEIEGLKMMLSEREDHITQLLSSIQTLQQEKVKLINVLENEKQSLTSLQVQDTNILKLLNERLTSESNLQMELEREKSTSEQLSKQVVVLKSQLQDSLRTTDHLNNHSGFVQQEQFDRINANFEKQVGITESLTGEIKELTGQLECEKSRIIDLQNMLDVEKQHFQREMVIKSDQSNLIVELQRKNHELHLELVHAREILHLQKNRNSDLEKRLTKLQESQRKTETMETYETLLEMETLLRRNINENIQMSETVRELTQERRDLQAKVRQLENQIKLTTRHSTSMFNLPDGVDQQVSFLHGRYMRVESYRKALVWQKRFLVRIAAAGFIIQNWKNSSAPPVQKFKCVAFAIIAVSRMKYLVKRWHTGNRIGANLHLNKPNLYPSELRNSKSYSHIPSCSYKVDGKSRHSLTNTLGLYSGGTKLGNKAWTGNSNPNISLYHTDRLNDWSPSHYDAETLPEHSFTRISRVSGVVLEENETTQHQNGQHNNESSVCGKRDRIIPVKDLTSEVPSTSSRFNVTPREPLDAKLHRALFSPREHDI